MKTEYVRIRRVATCHTFRPVLREYLIKDVDVYCIPVTRKTLRKLLKVNATLKDGLGKYATMMRHINWVLNIYMFSTAKSEADLLRKIKLTVMKYKDSGGGPKE